MKGLKLTEIESHGLTLDFKRFYLTEHPLLPKVSYSIGNYTWYDGKIIAVYTCRRTAEREFGRMSKKYLATDIDFA